MTDDIVTKFDARQVKAWMHDLRHVLPIIPSRDGFVLAKDERLLLHFLLGKNPINEGVPGVKPEEAYALAGVLENLGPMVEALVSQQRDFVMVRRALAKVVGGTATPRQLDEIRLMIEDTAYIEGNK